MSDYIKRKKTRNHLFDRLIETANNNTGYLSDASLVYQDAAERIRLWIDEIPAADVVERKRGEWIHRTGNKDECSNCSERYYQDLKEPFMRYCPNCGAQMEN